MTNQLIILMEVINNYFCRCNVLKGMKLKTTGKLEHTVSMLIEALHLKISKLKEIKILEKKSIFEQ